MFQIEKISRISEPVLLKIKSLPNDNVQQVTVFHAPENDKQLPFRLANQAALPLDNNEESKQQVKVDVSTQANV